MSFKMSHDLTWQTLAFFLILVLAALAVQAEDLNPNASPLTLDAAIELAITAQPKLDSLNAQIRAAQASGVAARQLPDPQLKIGIADWPITTRDALSFTRDSDTQLQVGITQEFPRAEKRRLRGELLDRESDRLRAEEHLATRGIRRDTALAWLEVWRYERTRTLIQAGLNEADTQRQAVEIALRVGAATQADYLSARQELSRLEDVGQAAQQNADRARATLVRWIGEAAFRPVASEALIVPRLPPLESVLTRVSSHPHLAGAIAQVAVANTNAELARAAYHPDWRVELSYGDRPAFSNMVSLQVGIDLPLFPGQRQDQGMLAAVSQKEAAESAREDASRQLLAEVRASYQDASHLLRRLASYDTTLLPDSHARIEATLAGWRAGRNQFREVLDARRTALDSQMARLEVQTALFKAYTELLYFGAYSPTPNDDENSHE